MRSVVKEDETVGLLLFDEPSASLDPAAEHGKLLSTSLCVGTARRRGKDTQLLTPASGQTGLIA